MEDGADFSRPMRILVVEDDPMVRELVELILRNRGWETVTAETGDAAIQRWRVEKIDLILMDVQLPGMDGLDVTRAIRREEGELGKHIPILAMTAHAREEDREQCLEAGMDGYLSKLIRMDDLYTAIERIAKSRRK